MIRNILIIVFCLCSILHAVYLHEGWDAGSFAANAWHKDASCENWQVMNIGGYHLRFGGFPELENYNSSLQSQIFDLAGVSSLSLEFKLKGISLEATQSEYMAVEYRIDNSEWIAIFDIEATIGDVMDPLESYSYSFSEPIAGNTIRFRFRAYGENSANFMFWQIDDILLKDQDYQAPAIISGIVTDSNMQAIADALVSDGQNYVRTGFSGTYTLPVQPSAQIAVTARAFSYYDGSAQLINIESEASAIADITLQAEDGELMDPFAMNASVYYSDTGASCGVYWNAVHEFPGDGVLELAYDSPPVDYFYNPFMINECEYMVVKYERDWDLNLGAVKLALRSMMPTSVELVAFYESNGQPDLNNPVFDSPQIFDFVPEVSGYPQWQQFPLPFFIEAQTPFYLGVKYRNGDLYSVGITPTDESRTYYSFDSENDWEISSGEAAMIRLLGNEYEPWDARNLLGYNLYRNHQLVNDTPLMGGYYYDDQLDWGEHIYYATAVYSTGESNITNSVCVNVRPVAISSVNLNQNPSGDQYVIVSMIAYKVHGGVSSLSLLRNGIEIYNYANPDPEQNLLECIHLDYNLENDTAVEYQLLASYLDGSSSLSAVYQYRCLLPPENLVAEGCEAGVALSWDAPVSPNRALLGYRISRNGNGDYLEFDTLILETEYLDTGMELGLVYDYLVSAVYEDGVADSPLVSVVAGPAVYHPVTNLESAIENNQVKLRWDRPDDTYMILSKNAPGKSQGFAPGHNFTAGINFIPGQMMDAINHISAGLAFIPVSDAPVTVRAYNCSNPEEEYLCDEIVLETPTAGEWNFVPCYSINVESMLAAYRFELETDGGLMLDDATSPVAGANAIMVDGEISDLQTQYGINQNWKFAIKLKETDHVNPCTRDLYPVLTGYKVVCNSEEISMESEFDQFYQEPASNDEYRAYFILAVYDTGESDPSNTVEVAPVSISDEDIAVPSIALQNHPNPFNPNTKISFNLREASDIKLQIFNVKGQIVKTLHQGHLAAGKHTLIWNGIDDNKRPVSSGIYFLRLDDGRKINHKKMCLQK
jgi:hypothetical protein